MKGGTVFHFVTDGIEAALQRPAVGGGDQVHGGGVARQATGRQIDEIHPVIAPALSRSNLLRALMRVGRPLLPHGRDAMTTHLV